MAKKNTPERREMLKKRRADQRARKGKIWLKGTLGALLASGKYIPAGDYKNV